MIATIQSFEDYVLACEQADFNYQFTDDPAHYHRQEELHQTIKRASRIIDPDLNVYHSYERF